MERRPKAASPPRLEHPKVPRSGKKSAKIQLQKGRIFSAIRATSLPVIGFCSDCLLPALETLWKTGHPAQYLTSMLQVRLWLGLCTLQSPITSPDSQSIRGGAATVITSRADVDPTISTRLVVPLRGVLSHTVLDPGVHETSASNLTNRLPGPTGCRDQALHHASEFEPYGCTAVNVPGCR
jgi:hypothetical protein